MILPLISVGALLVVVFIIVLIVTGLKNETDKGGKTEHEMIKNVYIYLVLFATLMMTIGGSVGVFMAAADIIAPVPYHQTFEEYKRFTVERLQPDTGTTDNEEKLTEEELKQQYKEMVLLEKERQLNRAKNNLIKSFGWIVIPLPVFIYFQRRLVKKEI